MKTAVNKQINRLEIKQKRTKIKISKERKKLRG